MLIFDSHLDLALNGVDWNRDLRLSVDEIRRQEIELQMTAPGRRHNTLSLPELRASEVAVCLTTLLARQEPRIDDSFGWTSPQTCYAMAHAHWAYYRALESSGHLKMLKTASELKQHWDAYRKSPNTEPLGFIMTMEGADPLLEPDTIYEFHAAGLRALGLTHYGVNRYGGGTSTDAPLAPAAFPLLKLCEELGMTIDVTHLSDTAFWQVIENFHGRIHASHQNARGICNWQRQFSDDQIRVVLERDGVLGVAFDVIMLQPGFVRGTSVPEVTLDRAIKQIEYVQTLAGGSLRNIGLGTDLDGAFGYEQTPLDLNRYRDLQSLVERLQARGFSLEEVQNLFHGNWLRFFSEALPA
ncbi:MAG: membrane dipeptidase [Planctomycetaceae bacterium]|nr:membrane dipeptidase [Planctomycetaceae bacterium]